MQKIGLLEKQKENKMVQSKAWNWEMVAPDDEYWNTPDPEIYYLAQNWKNKGYKKFLDIGCGLGRNALYLAKQGFCVTTFDLSEKSVEVVKQKFEDNNLVLDDIKVCDMLEMNYPENSFDCILAMNVISHTDTQGFKEILEKIRKMLKPGGEVFFTLGSKQSYWYNREDLPVVDECTKIRIEDGPENGIPHFYVNDEDCLRLFTDFKIVNLRHVSELTSYGSFSPHYYVWLRK